MIYSKSRLLLGAALVSVICAGVLVAQDNNAIGTLVGRTDANMNLYVRSAAAGAAGSQRAIGNLVGRTDANMNLYVTFDAASQFLGGDGTALLPNYSFASEPTLGFWRSSSSVVTLQGSLVIVAANPLLLNNRIYFSPPATGVLMMQNAAATFGTTLKFDALPTVSACGAGSPAVIAGSTPLSGGVTVGTGAPATCAITFNGAAYPSTPRCSGAVETTTAANARAMGYSASTTVLTIVPATAWADGSVVNWHCISAK